MSKGGKTVAFKVPAAKLSGAADAWVASRDAEPTGDREGAKALHLKPVEATAKEPAPAKDKLSRLTIDIPEGMHRRVKAQCAARGVKMADVIRVFLEREFPAA